MRIIGAYANRRLEECDEIQRRTALLEYNTGRMVSQMGALGLVPPEQYQGGPSQVYYEQGYYSTHPPSQEEGTSGDHE